MPRYDIECQACKHVHEVSMSFEARDKLSALGYFATDCPDCSGLVSHRLVITAAPAVEWRTDGAYAVDNADEITKYQRTHFAQSGDLDDKKLRDRNRRRNGKPDGGKSFRQLSK